MKSLVFSRYALSSCVAAAILSGCGGSQSPISTSSGATQSSAIERSAPCSESSSANGVIPVLTQWLSNRSNFPPASDMRSATPESQTLKSQTFHYTGAEQSFKVPSRVTSINVVAKGAAGAAGASKRFGLGGRTTSHHSSYTSRDVIRVRRRARVYRKRRLQRWWRGAQQRRIRRRWCFGRTRARRRLE